MHTFFCHRQSTYHIAPYDDVHHGRQYDSHRCSGHISANRRGRVTYIDHHYSLLTFPLPWHLQHLLVHVPRQLWQAYKQIKSLQCFSVYTHVRHRSYCTFTEAVWGTCTSQLAFWNIGGVLTIMSHGIGAGPLAGPSTGKPNQYT